MKKEQTERKIHIAQDDDTEKLREWWKRNGVGIIAGIILGVGGVGGIQGWRMYLDHQGEKASVLYEQMLAADVVDDQAAVIDAATVLIENHQSSGYADLARLMLARQFLYAEDVAAARSALNELLEESKDPVMQQVARVRLAVIALQAGDVDQVRALAEASAPEGFVSQFQELLGDALMASGDLKAAQIAYEKALANAPSNSQAAQLISAKLNMTRRGDPSG
ncbi:YfgM family protein [Arenicellales bacterium IMCC56312]